MLCCSHVIQVVLIRLGDQGRPLAVASGSAELHQGQWVAQRHVDGVQLLSWHAKAAPGKSEAMGVATTTRVGLPWPA